MTGLLSTFLFGFASGGFHCFVGKWESGSKGGVSCVFDGITQAFFSVPTRVVYYLLSLAGGRVYMYQPHMLSSSLPWLRIYQSVIDLERYK